MEFCLTRRLHFHFDPFYKLFLLMSRELMTFMVFSNEENPHIPKTPIKTLPKDQYCHISAVYGLLDKEE